MNKGRIEAFTDAVLAIILTIMILEIQTPRSTKFIAIFSQIPYILSYAVGYLFIGVAWYDHHYLFSKAHHINKQIFWANLFWMFMTSFIPVSTAWVGKNMNAKGPAVFYAIIFFLWTVAYIILTQIFIKNEYRLKYYTTAQHLKKMRIYSILVNWKITLTILSVWVFVLIIFPAAQLVLMTIFILLIGAPFNKDGDQLFIPKRQ